MSESARPHIAAATRNLSRVSDAPNPDVGLSTFDVAGKEARRGSRSAFGVLGSAQDDELNCSRRPRDKTSPPSYAPEL